MISEAESITHQHLLSVLNTELAKLELADTVRVLDIGCGDGHLIKYLTANIGVLNPAMKFEIYGFDVDDHGVQSEGYFAQTIALLEESFPNIPWQERLRVISADEPWPYPDGFFDIVLSNQVLEHVADHPMFFAETYRTLRDNGIAVHLFPSKHCVYEVHLHLPWVHRISNHDMLVSYIRLLSWLGLGKYKHHNKKSPLSVEKFAQRHADYIFFFTNYLTCSELYKHGKNHHLPTTFRYSKEFYSAKLRSIFGLKPIYIFNKNRSVLVDWLSVFFLRYVSAVTLVQHKIQRYTDQD
ncbi:class I SAM-dependent methyltransferase [Sneathiella sp.]|jgi:SAM-dependent methyltransferase|uniref:class I SAM-dependent methyltransferase n=1 Tax=Sneathiella sp. TaxID=1964365 RepID=UPI0039E690DA